MPGLAPGIAFEIHADQKRRRSQKAYAAGLGPPDAY
jgi:hypothetical protein